VSATITEPLDVVDISVGGLALIQGMKKEPVGANINLRVVFPQAIHPVDAVVRWVAKGMVGVELVNPPEPTAKAFRQFIGELLERGGGV
jgi:hypothetical protein